jgi:ATP-dependent RNA helicase MSS116, mitochondrial
LRDFPVIELHSKKSQEFRERQAKIFVNNNKHVLFTSDVSARGVDYPDVTLIIQVGATEKDPYIHRVGRTARAGGIEGRGLLILSDHEEQYMAGVLSDLPL